MVERHAFLRGLTWLCPFAPYDEGEESWPPKPLGALSDTATGTGGAGRRRPLASRIILKDCACCLTRGRDVLFFAMPTPGGQGEEDDDPAQMSFSMALMEVNPTAARAALTERRRRARREARRQARAEQEEQERQRRLREQAVAAASLASSTEEGASVGGSSASSSLLIVPPPLPRQQQQPDEDEEDEEDESWAQEEAAAAALEEGEDDPALVVPALFFRIAGKVYLVDHSAVETIVCPRLGEEGQQAPPPPPPQQASEGAEPQQQGPPPYAALKFPTVTLRFWLARLSLSPLNATQPLVSAIDAISRALTPRVWVPPALEPRGDGEWELGQLEACLRAVDTLLMPPLAQGWPPGEAEALLRVAGRAFARAVGPRGIDRGRGRVRALQGKEAALKGHLEQALHRLFPLRRPWTAGSAAAAASSVASSTHETDEWMAEAERAAAGLKALARERHVGSLLLLRTVLPPRGEEPDTQQQLNAAVSAAADGSGAAAAAGVERPAKRARS